MAATDLAAWLRELGLERYEPAFRAHDIDADVLPELSEADLEKLGVSLGHRKRLLKAWRNSRRALAGHPDRRGQRHPKLCLRSTAVRLLHRPRQGARRDRARSAG